MKKILMLVAIVFAVVLLVGLVRYPEQYLTTWKHQLKRDIENGDPVAIEYYETNYLANGIELFGEE